MNLRPKFAKIPQAAEYGGVGRTKLYGLAAQHPGLFKKLGKATLVDLDLLDKILAGLPTAEIRVPSLQKGA